MQEWRNEWAKALFGDDAAKEEYKDKRDFYYGVCECYYQKKRTNKDGPYMVKGASHCTQGRLIQMMPS